MDKPPGPGRLFQVYLLSGFYNNTLLEYHSLHSFTEKNSSTPAKVLQLPFYWQGTGHVVYNGFLYYHKADTPNQILKVRDSGLCVVVTICLSMSGGPQLVRILNRGAGSGTKIKKDKQCENVMHKG